MSKKIKNKICIIFLYFISLFLFEFFIGQCNFEKNAQECIENGYNFFSLFFPYFLAGFWHFVFVSCVALYVGFNKKIDNEYKHIIYLFLFFTYIFSLPMGYLAIIFDNMLRSIFSS